MFTPKNVSRTKVSSTPYQLNGNVVFICMTVITKNNENEYSMDTSVNHYMLLLMVLSLLLLFLVGGDDGSGDAWVSLVSFCYASIPIRTLFLHME